jgi:hypothetical protein
MKSVQQDALTQCGLLDCHVIGTYEKWGRGESIGATSVNVTGRCGA